MRRFFLASCSDNLYAAQMQHGYRIRFWFTLLIAALLLTGCATARPTVPTAVLYNRDRDEFSVEVRPVPEGQEPVYPKELEFVTLIDGERHDGLIPPQDAFVELPAPTRELWRGPYYVIYYKREWTVIRNSVGTNAHELNTTTHPVHCIFIPEQTPPGYRFTISGFQYVGFKH